MFIAYFMDDGENPHPWINSSLELRGVHGLITYIFAMTPKFTKSSSGRGKEETISI